MNWLSILGVACTISLFLPVAAIAYYRLYKHRSLAALGISYLVTAVYNLLAHDYFVIDDDFLRTLGVMTNYLDIPLMLFALLFFCPVRQRQRPVHLVAYFFIGYEVIIALIFGFTPEAIAYIMGPGLTIVLVYTFYLFMRQVKFSVIHGKNAGRALMLASILFAYSCYSLVYIFYYLMKTKNVADAFIVYFMTSMISCCMMTAGIHLTRKRIRQLEEARITRRELAVFFNN